jgi:hypothetical protein
MDDDAKLDKKDLDMVAGGAGEAPADAPEPLYHVGDRVYILYFDMKLKVRVARMFYDTDGVYSATQQWVYYLDDQGWRYGVTYRRGESEILGPWHASS